MKKGKRKTSNQEVQTRRVLASQALKCMQRAVRLLDKIDEAFGGEPFDRRWPPDHRKNIRRFRLYIAMQMELFTLCDHARKVYLRASGVGPEEWLELGIGVPQSAAQGSGGDIPSGWHAVAYTPSQVLLQRDEPSEQPNAASRNPSTSDEAGSASRRGGRLQ